MNLVSLLTYLFVLKKINNKSGNDERYELVEDKSLMSKIIENYQKKELLDYLTSDKISIFNKIDSINKFYGTNIPKSFNLTSGGLFKDWDLEM